MVISVSGLVSKQASGTDHTGLHHQPASAGVHLRAGRRALICPKSRLPESASIACSGRRPVPISGRDICWRTDLQRYRSATAIAGTREAAYHSAHEPIPWWWLIVCDDSRTKGENCQRLEGNGIVTEIVEAVWRISNSESDRGHGLNLMGKHGMTDCGRQEKQVTIRQRHKDVTKRCGSRETVRSSPLKKHTR